MHSDATNRATAAFNSAFGSKPTGTSFAPGRINLIGDHVDYQNGLVLPMPVATGTAIAWKATQDSTVTIYAADFSGQDSFDAHAADRPDHVDWRSYCRGMFAHAASFGVQPVGMQIAIAGNMPRGSGLSSSASLCIALGRAMAQAASAQIDPRALALAAQRTEHEFADVACGIMDQMAVALGQPGCAMLLDCRDLTTTDVAIPSGWSVLGVESGVQRGLVDGAYNERRSQCEAACRALNIATLRDGNEAMIAAASLDPIIASRARHVVREIARVRDAVKAMKASDIASLGALINASHASLRDDFETSVPAVDQLVKTIQRIVGRHGGARMTGGGFGGTVVTICESDHVAAVQDAVGRDHSIFVAHGT